MITSQKRCPERLPDIEADQNVSNRSFLFPVDYSKICRIDRQDAMLRGNPVQLWAIK